MNTLTTLEYDDNSNVHEHTLPMVCFVPILKNFGLDISYHFSIHLDCNFLHNQFGQVKDSI